MKVLSDYERARLSQIITEARESDPTVVRERQFAVTNTLIDLALLVEALELAEDWTRLVKYAAILFQRSPRSGQAANSMPGVYLRLPVSRELSSSYEHTMSSFLDPTSSSRCLHGHSTTSELSMSLSMF